MLRSGFHDRDMSLVPEEEDEGGWDSCIMEGYLQIRGGKMGDGKHKQKYLTNSLYSRATHRAMYLIKGRFGRTRYFRMRDTMMVMYKKKSPKGKYGKGSTRYLKVRSAPTLVQRRRTQPGADNLSWVRPGDSGTHCMP